MLKNIIEYFVKRHFLTNLLFLTILIGGVISWQKIKKEEMPDITFDRIRVSAVYPGATAEEVEHFVTRELEEGIKGVDGVYRVTSSASQGNTSINIELDQYYPDKDEAIMEIRNAVLDAKLPDDVRDKPSIRVFKTSKKAIVDIAIIHTGHHLLDTEARKELQRYALSLENQLINLPQVNSINKSGYRQEEFQININPEQLKKYAIPLSQVRKAISENHARLPAGHIEAKNEPKVTINAQLDTVDKLKEVFVQAGFEGKAIALKEVAEVENAFVRDKEIIKVNGHEAVLFNVVKNSNYGILDSLNAVLKTLDWFKDNYLKDIPIDIVVLDDESMDVRNRLSIISMNGALGFVLVLITLFLFLNKQSGLWVGMGIPFTICFTLVCSLLLGYTINNTTLAAVIIVMGIVVDDAIVIAENITRFRYKGYDPERASVEGTLQVFLPVLASLVTTCIAFIPLYFFSGRFGKMNSFIPPIIFLMLGASLFESLLLLPGHMNLRMPFFRKKEKKKLQGHWFDFVENIYGWILERILPFKYLIILIFISLLVYSGHVGKSRFKFVMFPDEETREIVLSGSTGKDADRYDTAEKTREIEEVIRPFIGAEVVGFRTEIARSRRGGAVEENKFRMIVEIVPKEQRQKSADELIDLWKPEIDQIQGMEKLMITKSRWGQSSGSPIEVVVQENDDKIRENAVSLLAKLMKENKALTNVDIEKAIKIPEYKIGFKREKIKRLAISPTDISSTFRTSLEGTILYELPNGNEEIDVRLSVRDLDKTDIEKLLDIPVENNRDYLVPLRDVIDITKTETPNSISRWNYKRTTTVYSDIATESKKTPLEVATYLETEVFPKINKVYPSVALSFSGEVFDTRESQGDLFNAIVLVIFLIFAVLAVLFNSFSRPVIIMLAIPFGMVGVIFTFLLHGKLLFGFFAAIGCLGLAGVVINDSIVMLSKLDDEFDSDPFGSVNKRIAGIAKTRLKAITLTTVTTVAGVMPTAYGVAGYDAMLAEMMLALAWGLIFGTLITLLLIPCLYSIIKDGGKLFRRMSSK